MRCISPGRPASRAAALLAKLTCALCIVVQAACTTPAPTPGKPKLALVIGNLAYSVFRPLVNPANDAADMCAALKRLGFETMCITDVSTRDEFVARVQEFVDQLGAETKAVFYYSGHGVQAQNENYLVPTDTQSGTSGDDLTQQLFALSELFATLKQKRTAFQLIVLDACRDNPSFSAAPANQPGSQALESEARTRRVKSLLVTAKATYGLRPIKDAPVGTIVLYATAADNTAYEGSGRYGPLTEHLLAHLETPGINVEEMIKRVTRGVQEDTSGGGYAKQQTPFVYSSFSGNFCFAGCAEQMFVTPTF